MKNAIILILIGIFSISVQAEEFKFTYLMGRDKLEYKTEAQNWETAFKRGADFCFNFFAKREKVLTDEKGLDIIDTCANPREK